MNCSMPGLPVHHQLLESTQTHVHFVGDAIQLADAAVELEYIKLANIKSATIKSATRFSLIVTCPSMLGF